MKITFLTPADDLSGGLRVIVLYAQLLRARGHDVEIVCNAPNHISWRARLRALRHGQWAAIRERLKQKPGHIAFSGVPYRVLDRPRAATAADVRDGDVVIATWWETAEWVERLPAAKGAKVHFMQDYEVWAGFEERVDATCRLPMPKITPSRWVADMLEERFGHSGVTVAPNAVDLDRFRAPPRGKQPVPTVGFTYTNFRNKGADIVVQAIQLARRDVPALRAISFGSALPTAELPIPPDFEFHPSVPDDELRTLYAAADMWLFGSRKEGFGLPILEAMACRTPVIGTPAGAARELLARGGGILVPMEDPPAMAREIVRICEMGDTQWRALSDAAHANATGYTWADATDIFERALRRAVSDRVG